ncbi:5'-nucleotidase C-terminal domain-containing protein [Alicyclobacillus tolerans]|uniref:bifunctional metallophosphatase/5'-nucleotidase n=1 Tax=Alicyclobacillus tolerans TaxID=90970 RepID=UPI001F01EC06|nr:5'-nucleotidase C-terminal domain-containing protein [Alicyclobacillus tolerans]MCF8563876.1 5'-nucleotidase C-terminal domain-containing protein [Alicyclobacillus tolerans]
MKIHLLHVNDVHSQLENYMRLGHQLREVRNRLKRQGQFVITVDIGDALDRVRPETEATCGHVNAAMMAALGVDAWIFGNNEGLTIPVEEWGNLVTRANTTAFGTNLQQESGKPFPFFRDSLIVQERGVKIGFFGLTPDYVLPYGVLGVRPLAPFAKAQEAVADLRRQGCQVVVLLSHLGLYADRQLAAAVPGIDLILGGHTHHFLSAAEQHAGTAVFQSGKHAVTFGHTVIDFDEQRGQVAGIECKPVEVDPQGPYDQQMLSAYRGYLPDIEERLSAPVVFLPERLPVNFDRESLLANVLADAMFEESPCDLGLVMTGSLTASLLVGWVEMRHVLGACSTPTRPLAMTLTGREIRSILAKSIQPEFYNKTGFGYGFRGSVVGYMAMANATAEVEVRNGTRSLGEVTVGGEPLDPHRDYRLITSEYLWLSSVFEEFKNGRHIVYQKPLVRELLLDRLKRDDFLDLAKHSRYEVSHG